MASCKTIVPNVGIGTTTPNLQLEVAGSSANIAATRYGGGAGLKLTSTAGTQASPTAITSGNYLGVVQFMGHDGSTTYNLGAQMSATSAENYTSSAHGADLNFSTVPIGSTGLQTRMTILNSGNVGIADTTPDASLDVAGTLGLSGSTSGTLTFAAPATVTSGTYVWPAATPASNMVLQSSNTGQLTWVAAGGSVAGADTQIQYNNAGAAGASADFVWNNTTKVMTVTGDINYTGVLTDTSDRRLKEDIQPIESALPKIRKMKMYSYLMRNDPNNRREFGVMAQDMMEIIPELVSPIDDTYFGVNYLGLTAWTLQAIQELDAENQKLREENRKLAGQLQELKSQQEVQARQIQSIMEKLNSK